MRLGPFELILIFSLVLLFFGAGKIPAIAGELGSGIRSFKKGLEGVKKKAKDDLEDKLN